MSRFTIAERKGGKSAMRVINKDNLLAFFDFQDNDTGLLYRDFKLMDGKNGHFIGSPTGKPYEDKDGKTRYPEFVSAIYDEDRKSKRNEDGESFFKEVLELAEEEYERLNDDDDEDEDEEERPRRGKKSSRRDEKKGKKSGAGALKSRRRDDDEDEDEDEDKLPF